MLFLLVKETIVRI